MYIAQFLTSSHRTASSARPLRPRAGYELMLCALSLVVALTACTAPPIKEFEGYTEAFEEVRNITYILVQDYENTVDPRSQRPKLGAPPSTFDPEEFRAPAETSDTEQRRRSVDAVVLFNERMLALARGSSLEAVQSTLRPLSAMLGVAAPHFGSGASVIEGLIGRALQARDNATFVRAFTETTVAAADDEKCVARPAVGRRMDPTCAPIVEGIIETLIQDTQQYYAARLKVRTSEHKSLADLLRQAGLKIRDLGHRFERPDPGTALGQTLEQLESEYFQAVQAITEAGPRQQLVGRGSGTYDESTEAAVQALMTPVRDIRTQAVAATQGLADYHAVLGQYVKLLDRTIDLLRETQAAAATPPSVFAIVERLSLIRSDLSRDAVGTREALLRAISVFQQR